MPKIIVDIKTNGRNYDEETDSDDEANVYEENDLILCKTKDGNIRSCGFSVNNLLLREGRSPMMTINSPALALHEHGSDMMGTNHVSDVFKHLAVPTGFFYMHSKNAPSKRTYIKEENDIGDDLYEKLLALASVSNNNVDVHAKAKRATKKMRRSSHDKKTKKTRV